VTGYNKHVFYKFLTITHIIEEVILRTTKEGTKIAKRRETEWLAGQLRTAKHRGEISNNINNIASQIGQTCVFIYTMETFWYKLINSVLGNFDVINETHLRTLDLFIYFLKQILRGDFTANILTFYCGVDLTYQQIQQYITTNSCFDFTLFTSTSMNRTLAEIYDNSLFIICLNLINVYGDNNIWVGAYVASLSNFSKEKGSSI
jgi:hypothetical protein